MSLVVGVTPSPPSFFTSDITTSGGCSSGTTGFKCSTITRSPCCKGTGSSTWLSSGGCSSRGGNPYLRKIIKRRHLREQPKKSRNGYMSTAHAHVRTVEFIWKKSIPGYKNVTRNPWDYRAETIVMYKPSWSNGSMKLTMQIHWSSIVKHWGRTAIEYNSFGRSQNLFSVLCLWQNTFLSQPK